MSYKAQKEQRCSACEHCKLTKTDVSVVKTSSGRRFDTGWVRVCDISNMRIKSSELDDLNFCRSFKSIHGEKKKRKGGSTSTSTTKTYTS